MQNISIKFYVQTDLEPNNWTEIERDELDFERTVELQPNAQEIKYKVIISVYTKDEEDKKIIISQIESNILTFKNSVRVPDQATIDALTSATLECENNGAFILYKEDGNLIPAAGEKSNPDRWITCKLNGEEVPEGATFTWIFPTENTMIASGEEKYSPSTTFKIGEFYSPLKNNNTIKCKIEYNGITYNAEKALTFGIKGSMGTEYTIVLQPENEEPFLRLYSDKDTNYVLVPHLYDENGVEIEDVTFAAEWLSKNDANGISCAVESDGKVHLRIKKGTSLEKCKYYILKVTCNEAIKETTLQAGTKGEVKFYINYPIGVLAANHPEVTNLQGPVTVLYDTKGVDPKYDDVPFKLYNIDGVTWNSSIKSGKDEETKFAPSVGTNGVIVVPPLFITNAPVSSVNALKDGKELFAQAIYVGQYPYSSIFMNSWDGSLLVDEDNNAIVSAMIGAGYKDNENTFNGVLMGTAEGDTGLFGYGQGARVFSLGINGKLQLGKSGKGQITFDGDSGIIQSGNYGAFTGMKIDLSEGHIDSYNFNLTSSNLVLSSLDPFLTIYGDIKNNTRPILMQVGTNNYYLQSANFNAKDKSGSKFDLIMVNCLLMILKQKKVLLEDGI